jgi:hypothetical protein
MLNVATQRLNGHFGQDFELQRSGFDLFGIFANLLIDIGCFYAKPRFTLTA